jgi:hypothetical protein
MYFAYEDSWLGSNVTLAQKHRNRRQDFEDPAFFLLI